VQSTKPQVSGPTEHPKAGQLLLPTTALPQPPHHVPALPSHPVHIASMSLFPAAKPAAGGARLFLQGLRGPDFSKHLLLDSSSGQLRARWAGDPGRGFSDASAGASALGVPAWPDYHTDRHTLHNKRHLVRGVYLSVSPRGWCTLGCVGVLVQNVLPQKQDTP
jgi:hypothetical protein